MTIQQAKGKQMIRTSESINTLEYRIYLIEWISLNKN